MVEKAGESDPFAIPRKIEFLLKLSLYENKPSRFEDYARYLGIVESRRDLRAVLHFLIQQEIMVPVKQVFNHTWYRIQMKKLRAFIADLAITELFFDYFDAHHVVAW